ncbi:CNNM domain-containing protein [Lutibacter sp.]|uniref:CNNM domain-containing protein n=1 Tax=Lutibacter sp. TaxID=1925666 RepID=UPI0027365F5C|nr:hemolysin family protein [Lutibacter sp.]MDP3312396.1 hemolysin family protein [Lutibacter sp.]
MTLLLTYAIVSIFFSFLCSILEAVLLSSTPTFISVKKQEGKAYAKILENLKKDVDKPLIAILTLNTIAHTVGAIMVGFQADKLDFKINFLGFNTVGIVSALMTFLILVTSEIIPKTIGAIYWRQLANFSAKALVILIFPLKYTGILWLLQLTTKLIGGSHTHGSILSREDFHTMTNIAHQEGVFEAHESTIIKNLLTFKKVHAKDVMTPRTVMISASDEKSIQDFYDEHPKLHFSRIPIFNGSTDNVVGYILKDVVMEEIIKGNGNQPLKNIVRNILITHRNLPIPNLFETFVTQREHIALVVDEFGSVSGIVTMEDVIETLLGLEIMDESDNDADLQLLARKSWETRAKKFGLLIDKSQP